MRLLVAVGILLLGLAMGTWATTAYLAFRGEHAWSASLVPVDRELQGAEEEINKLTALLDRPIADTLVDTSRTGPQHQLDTNQVDELRNALAHIEAAREIATDGRRAVVIDLGEVGSYIQVLLMLTLAVIVAAILGTDTGRAFFRRAGISSLPLFGGSLVLDTPEEGERIERIFTDSRDRIIRQMQQFASDDEATHKLQRVISTHLLPRLANGGAEADLRATLHVPDPLFLNVLTQYLNYSGSSGGGQGRTFTTRFGIIGRAWRLKEDLVEGSVTLDNNRLITDWGMTLEETKTGAGRGRQSFAAILLKDETTTVGVFYVDAKTENAFAVPGFAELARGACRDEGLTGVASRFFHQVTSRGPRVRVVDE